MAISSGDDEEAVVKRSRSGCFTCRQRKKRCDETKPICKTCSRLKLQCVYPLPGDRKNKKRKKTGTDIVASANRDDAFSEGLSKPNGPNRRQVVGNDQSVEFSPSFVDDLLFPLHFTEDVFDSLDVRSTPPPLDLSNATFYAADIPSHLDPGKSVSESEVNRSQSFLKSSGDQREVEQKPTLAVLRKAYPSINADEIKLFEYFRDKQSQLMSVSTLNYFRSVFLAMSLRFRPVLDGILAWASFHSGQEESGKRYLTKTANYLQNDEAVPKSKEEILATLLILASSKICSGDVSDWRQYMHWAAMVIHQYGGLTSFMESESVRWLLKNFAYKEILTSSSLSTPTLFSSSDFEFIFSQSTAKLPDSLCGGCEPIFVTLAMINELSREVRAAENDDDICLTVQSKAYAIEQRIWTEKPDPEILINLEDQELKLQIALFEAFQQVAVLHLYQSALRMNSASFLVRCAHHHLLKFLTPLLTTQVEGCLIFPMFIAGICCADSNKRQYILELFAGLARRVLAGNVQQVESLMQEVWRHDQNGRMYVDWNEIADSKGLTFSFA